jgi:hypothetical protein
MAPHCRRRGPLPTRVGSQLILIILVCMYSAHWFIYTEKKWKFDKNLKAHFDIL